MRRGTRRSPLHPFTFTVISSLHHREVCPRADMEYSSRCDVALENGIKLKLHFIDIYIDCGRLGQRIQETAAENDKTKTDYVPVCIHMTHGCFETVYKSKPCRNQTVLSHEMRVHVSSVLSIIKTRSPNEKVISRQRAGMEPT